MAYVLHEPDGRVRQTIEGEVEESFGARAAALGLTLLAVDLAEILGRDIPMLYVDGRKVLDRPVLPVTISRTAIAADGKRLATITGIPPATTVVIDGTPHLVEDGRLDLVSTMPADYRIAIDRWPYLPWATTVSVR